MCMFYDGVGSCLSFMCGVAMLILLGYVTDSFDDEVSMKGYLCLQFVMCFCFFLALAFAGVVKF